MAMSGAITMFDTASEPLTQSTGTTFTAEEPGEPHIHQRNRPAPSTALDGVSVEAVDRALRATGYPALRGIQIEIERGIVVLWGRVPNYYQKQVAQVTAQRMPGVRGIANGIEVVCGR
jgi:osmotically-inducible protein OsmY